MKKNMFCPKCGADGQSAESYCKRCGEWLLDLDAIVRSPGLFRKRTREEKIRKMRVLEAVSAGLSLTAAAIITSVLVAGCVIVALYQSINFYLGYKLQRGIDQSRTNTSNEIEAAEDFRRLSAADTSAFVNRASVVENTTELLQPLPREAKRDSK
jgi:uncharacterized membrane protein YvbJ